MSFHAINPGKRSLCLDLNSEAGYQAALQLMRWADVLIEAFIPGVAESLRRSHPHPTKRSVARDEHGR
jgi:crotonobetainyl-CoA:carnitine CoA-transferase CaiB-like acyl-CoA transferase